MNAARRLRVVAEIPFRKACTHCGVEKNASDFARHSSRKDGLQAWCRACKREHEESYKLRPEVIAHRKQYLSDHADKRKQGYRDYRRAHAKSIREHDIKRNMFPARAAARRARAVEYKANNPIKTRAHAILNEALRSGEITRCPCEVCGAWRTDAHHDDYGHALRVRWLCREHHMEWHRSNSARLPRTVAEVKA